MMIEYPDAPLVHNYQSQLHKKNNNLNNLNAQFQTTSRNAQYSNGKLNNSIN